MFVRTQHIDEQKELKRELRRQDATKITSALTHSIFLVSDDDFGEIVVSVLRSYDTSSQCFTPVSSFVVTMSSSKRTGVERVNRWTRNAAQRREDYFYDALAFSQHNVNLELEEENMKPEQLPRSQRMQ